MRKEQGYDVPDSFSFKRHYKDQIESIDHQVDMVDELDKVVKDNTDLNKRKNELLIERAELELHRDVLYSVRADSYSQERIRQYYHDYSSGIELDMIKAEMWDPVEQQRFKDNIDHDTAKQLIESDKTEAPTKELLLYFRPYLISFMDKEEVTPKMQEIYDVNEVNHCLDSVEAKQVREACGALQRQ